MIEQIEKPAFNKEFRVYEFRRPDGRGQLNADETITAATVKTSDYKTGEDVTESMISQTGPYAQTKVKYRLAGGERGKTYLLEIQATTSNQQDLAGYLLVKVM
ncbi:hypothetical protein KP003_16565 [Geomonas nitrogeniifigens]|uniref:phage fiber-tail adaptor protein n=1 Tax=Geomonas diazotrophica TaxID=2843197 RepID=UPI001C2C5DD2|nr:hypothetical protein [Geomonas nitrogeniifigens]QXE85954.1 hypothetical protein KP003_16565 [Geomonas nitrogeniifigens]